MELKKLKEEDNKTLVEVIGETFTVTNAIREELWKDNSVSEAAQVREHPYLSNPKIFVAMKRGSAENALEKASDRLVEQAKEFSAEFKKALKK